jgi:hypothetical protein
MARPVANPQGISGLESRIQAADAPETAPLPPVDAVTANPPPVHETVQGTLSEDQSGEYDDTADDVDRDFHPDES